MSRTPDLFPDAPRRARRVMMHVIDAGSSLVRFACGRCRFETDWLPERTVTEDRRGWPCPRCNAEVAAE
jgi:hypothetical protein